MDCPFCAEEIKDEANVCKHCGRDLTYVRPVLNAHEALTKRLDALQETVDGIARSHLQVQHRLGLAETKIPSIHRGSAIALLLLWIFDVGLFIGEAVKNGDTNLALACASLSVILAPLIFGFLCQNLRTHPFPSDLATALIITVVAIVEIQLIRSELFPDSRSSFIPSHGPLALAPSGLPTNTWIALILNAMTILSGFLTGVFVRYWLQSRRAGRYAPVTFARPLSERLASRWRGQLSEADFEAEIKRMDALIKSLLALGSAAIMFGTFFYSHVVSLIW